MTAWGMRTAPTPSCLQYLADPGTRWAYQQNAPYTLLDGVIAGATGASFSNYFNTHIRNPIGMDGFWFPAGYNNVYFSKARSMARYGLLALNRGIWNTDTILHDTGYFTDMTTPSQGLNESYGYLWWLNGQPSFMIPTVQFVFPGMLMPDAPTDMFSALGKNDQLLNVVPTRTWWWCAWATKPTVPCPWPSCSTTRCGNTHFKNQLSCATGVADSTVRSTALHACPTPVRTR